MRTSSLHERIGQFLRSMNVRVLLFLSLLGGTLMARGQVLDPPSLRCINVSPAGDVTLTWVAPPDPNGIFSAYEIYHSTAAGGPFNMLATIPVYGQSSWFHPAAGANAGPQYYYMVTLSSSPPPNASVPGPVMASMFLTVNQSTPLGNAVVDWTLLSSPLPPTADPDQSVAMEHPLGIWSQVATVLAPQSVYEHVVSVCDDSLTFRVAVTDAIGCVSTSNLAGGTFQDVTPPSPPVMLTQSVDTATNQTVIDWAASPQGDTDGYIVVLITSGGNIVIDTVWGQNNTQYVWAGSDAGGGAESYTVAAFDTCYSGTPPSPNTSAAPVPSHTTMFTTIAYDKCGGDISVNWSPYVGFPVQAYQVFAQRDGGAVYLLGTYPAGVSSAPHDDVDPFIPYCYVVKAIEQGGTRTALSNKACRVTDYPTVPAWNYIRVATVAGEDHIQVIDSIDATAQVKRYRVERSVNGDPWQQVAALGPVPGPVLVYNDLDVVTAERSYTYRILVDDSCGNEVLVSNTANTILLQAEAGLDGFNRLRWNGYATWAGVVSGYTVLRAVGDGPFVAIAVTPPGQWSYDDNVEQLYTSNGRFCYQVEAIEAGNPALVNAVSVSNTVCAIQEEQVWIPNAFIAGGVNDSFKPVLAYADAKGYELTIFNRWGQAFWTTNDPQEAWDGTYNGQPVPQGVYGYYCSFLNGAGKREERRGTVTFIWGRE
ncbi:MAG: gliding motility-associated C-terminal domain-containing protein [Flavobacteriales bacterium]|nr:gliding motility-associated C-terminal domain-containing protein [Flavobacteriales bacterium]